MCNSAKSLLKLILDLFTACCGKEVWNLCAKIMMLKWKLKGRILKETSVFKVPRDLCILALHHHKQTGKKRDAATLQHIFTTHLGLKRKKKWANVLLIIASPREQALPERSIFDSARRAADAASKVPRAYWGAAALKCCLMTLPALCSLLFGRISRKRSCSAINIKKN